MNVRKRFTEFLEQRRERRALKRKPPVPQGAAPLIWVYFLAFIAAATLVGSTWMLMVFIAGSVGSVDWGFDWRAGNDGVPSRWQWFAEARIHLLVGLGLFAFCAGIAAFNAVWLHVRHHLHGLFRNVVTGLGALVALFMVSGAIVVQQWGTLERERDEIADVRATGVAAATARERLETARAQLRDLRNHNNQYMAVAASVGAAEFERSYLSPEALRGSDQARRDLLQRSLGAARRADALEAEIATLEGAAAEASVTAASAEVQRVELTGWMPAFSRFLEDVRKPFIAVLGELLAMTMFGVALAAAMSRRQGVEQSGWADEAHRVEDLRDQPSVVPQPMEPAREDIVDAETGERLIRVRPKLREYLRKAPKGRKQKIEDKPDPLPDEVGPDADGGSRQAAAKREAEHERDQGGEANEADGDGVADDLSPDVDAAIEAELAAVVAQENIDSSVDQEQNKGDEDSDKYVDGDNRVEMHEGNGSREQSDAAGSEEYAQSDLHLSPPQQQADEPDQAEPDERVDDENTQPDDADFTDEEPAVRPRAAIAAE